MKRSPKIVFLFWNFVICIILYLWIITIGIQTFILPEQKPLNMPQEIVGLMFALYGILIFLTVAGLIVSTMIGNSGYSKKFSGFVMIIFLTIITAKAIFG
jgi:hypothetical protein